MSSPAWTLSARENQFPRTFGVVMRLSDMLRAESEHTLAAVRHRLGRNTFRFIRETHLELPPQPPPARRTLVLFAHFDLHGFVDPYVASYLKPLLEIGATYVFVSST